MNKGFLKTSSLKTDTYFSLEYIRAVICVWHYFRAEVIVELNFAPQRHETVQPELQQLSSEGFPCTVASPLPISNFTQSSAPFPVWDFL